MTEIIEVTGKILFEIRDEIRKTNQKLDSLDGRLSKVEMRLDEMEKDVSGLRQDVKAIHGFLQRDMMTWPTALGKSNAI